MSPISETVVVLPFVPVTAASLPLLDWYASSISPQIGIFAPSISFTNGLSSGIPGLMTARSTDTRSVGFSSPTTSEIRSLFLKFFITFTVSSFSLESNRTTCPPSCKICFAAQIPLFPVPSTSTF